MWCGGGGGSRAALFYAPQGCCVWGATYGKPMMFGAVKIRYELRDWVWSEDWTD